MGQDRLHRLKDKYSDVQLIRDNLCAHHDRDTHGRQVSRMRGRDDTGHDDTFMNRDALFLLDSVRDISGLCRDWYNDERGVPSALDSSIDVTALLERIDLPA